MSAERCHIGYTPPARNRPAVPQSRSTLEEHATSAHRRCNTDRVRSNAVQTTQQRAAQSGEACARTCGATRRVAVWSAANRGCKGQRQSGDAIPRGSLYKLYTGLCCCKSRLQRPASERRHGAAWLALQAALVCAATNRGRKLRLQRPAYERRRGTAWLALQAAPRVRSALLYIDVAKASNRAEARCRVARFASCTARAVCRAVH